MHFKGNVPAVAAAAGHLPPVSAGFGTTAAPGAGGWVSGAALASQESAPRALLVKAQTGAFGTITGCQFKLRVATDANGTGAADVTNGACANITAANNEADTELLLGPGGSTVTIDPAKFYAVCCLVSGSVGTALVAATLSVLDPVHCA